MPESQTDRETTSRFEAEQVRAGLEQIRLRLLDLTTRNKLLSFRHTRSTLRIVDADLDKLYAEVVAGQKLSFLYLPEPTNEEISIFGEKPAARQYAEQLGWLTSFDLPPASGRSQCLPVLHYKEDFEALVRKIGAAAKTTIEESGVNLLHLVFGFLEWRESDDSTQVRHAPLLIVPIYLLTPKAREEDRSVKVQYAGEDLNTNLSLVEKMRRDFNIDIPTLLEDESPEHYFQRFDRILEQKRDWRICRQVSLGLLSFGKLLMYLDLDVDRWPEAAPLASHPRLVDIFAGRQATGLEFASEYDLDEEAKKGPVPQVICEADSSQHSALVDAVRGKNLVIEGPPGTGKSQTITNLISSFLGQGKRVLFIAEKMAALNVVKRRLDQYGLGDFCLELHSHKTSKIGLLKSLDARIDAHRGFGEPSTLAHKLGLLANRREELTKYVRLLNTPYASIAQSPFELIWHREEVRRGLPPELLSPQSVIFPEAHRWDFSALQEHKDTVGAFQAHLLRFQDAGGAIDKSSNPWSWLPPCELDHSAQLGLLDTLSKLRNACDSQRTLLSAFGNTYQQVFENPAEWLIRAPSWLIQIVEPSSLALPQFFASFRDPANYSVIHEFIGQRQHYVQLTSRLIGGTSLLDTDVPEQIEQHIQSLLAQGLTDFSLEKLRNLLDTLGVPDLLCRWKS